MQGEAVQCFHVGCQALQQLGAAQAPEALDRLAREPAEQRNPQAREEAQGGIVGDDALAIAAGGARQCQEADAGARLEHVEGEADAGGAGERAGGDEPAGQAE